MYELVKLNQCFECTSLGEYAMNEKIEKNWPKFKSPKKWINPQTKNQIIQRTKKLKLQGYNWAQNCPLRNTRSYLMPFWPFRYQTLLPDRVKGLLPRQRSSAVCWRHLCWESSQRKVCLPWRRPVESRIEKTARCRWWESHQCVFLLLLWRSFDRFERDTNFVGLRRGIIVQSLIRWTENKLDQGICWRRLLVP